VSICKLLRRFDTSAPGAGKVYSSWFEMGESIKASNASYKKEVEEKHAARWVVYAHHAFFAAGYVCDPEFIGHDQVRCCPTGPTCVSAGAIGYCLRAGQAYRQGVRPPSPPIFSHPITTDFLGAGLLGYVCVNGVAGEHRGGAGGAQRDARELAARATTGWCF
jgi:hypothetical protein